MLRYACGLRNEDMLAIHTVSRAAAFRVLFDLTKEGEAKKALRNSYQEGRPSNGFNEETNFLKHADQDPGAEIDENFPCLHRGRDWHGHRSL